MSRNTPSHARPRRTFATELGGRDNSFGFIRLVLATMVIVDHCFPLGGFGGDPTANWTKGQEELGSMAVIGFFALSGYLVNRSAERVPTVRYLWHRCLRIFPGFWVCILVIAFVIAPVLWLHEHGTFNGFLHGAMGPGAFVLNNLTFNNYGHWGIKTIALNTPYGVQTHLSVFDGSLWTLSYEFFMYLVVGALAIFSLRFRTKFALLFVALALAITMIITLWLPDGLSSLGRPLPIFPFFGGLQVIYLVMLGDVFLLGAVAAAYANKVPYDDRVGWLAVLITLVTLHWGWYLAFGIPATVYMILWLGRRLPTWLRRVGARNDYSYGMYIYGFPIAVALADFHVQRFGDVVYTGLTLLVTFLFAFASWRIVERRAMGLKDVSFSRSREPSEVGEPSTPRTAPG